ncbi:Uncharacterized protein Adt_45150 [Abeliophyllum distichum]|uniref:Uncharacterized protein n=1 Tax=Abeliophyllum distichum TaxID=126358 RepID=A0ABD1PCW8_9LAMI
MGQMAIALLGIALSTLPRYTEVNFKERVKVITTRSGVQLPEIHVKRSVANKKMVPSTDQEHMEQIEQTTNMKESSSTPQIKATVRIKPYDPPIPFPQRKLGLGEAKATTVTLQLADWSIKHPRGVIEDLLVKVDRFIFPTNFIILDMEKDRDVPLLLVDHS